MLKMTRPFTVAYVGLVLLLGQTACRATNPFITTAYSADPSAHVFEGRMYVYPSHDRNDAQRFDMTDYHVYSSDDLVNWRDHGVVLNLKDVAWAKPNSAFWAPDCGFKEGIYYFYFPVTGAGFGVATSKSLAGPFVDTGKPIPDVSGIDPAIFVDDDGQGCLYWAGAGCQGQKLKANMTELDGPALRLHGCNNFFEGPWMFKRNGIYYMTYPAKMKGGSGDGGNGQWFDYATSDQPLGPFTYRGHFSRSGPGVGNIHGSQVEWNGKWYCFYHDASLSVGQPKRGFKRSIRVDEMKFNADGSIRPLVWTSSGPAKLKNLDPYVTVSVVCLNQTDLPEGPHAVSTEPCSEGGMDIGKIKNGGWIKYASVDFQAGGAASFTARVASLLSNGRIELRLDRLDGELAGTCKVPATGGWQVWTNSSCPVTGAVGVRDLYLKFTGPGTGDLLNLQSYQFLPASKTEEMQPEINRVENSSSTAK